MSLLCPTKTTLKKLMEGELSQSTEAELWEHLDRCQNCRESLDHITEDTELAHWRAKSRADFPERPRYSSHDNLPCQQMIRQAARLDTFHVAEDTKDSRGSESKVEWLLPAMKPSEVPGDVGVLGNFRLIRRIGQGGMAYVFEATDTHLQRRVAVKVLKLGQLESLSKDRFLTEARSIAAINHPNVVSIYGISGADEMQPFIAMEFVEGGCLQTRIASQDPIEFRAAARWIAQIADGLATAHHAGLVHRDIKPSNILLSAGNSQKDSSKIVAKLADFGLAKHCNVPLHVTQTGVLLGTPSYMSPEHVSAPELVDARSDVYCLGVTLYETLTGEVPYRGTISAILQQIEQGDPPSLRSLDASIPVDLETICLKAMHRDPRKRYASAVEFGDDLRRWLNAESILARPTSALEKTVRWAQNNRTIAKLLVVVAGLLVLIALGSTLAAISISMADAKLRQEKENVVRASAMVKQSAEEARVQRQLAIDSLNSLVTKVQSTLANRAGTMKLREEILETALQGLDRITLSSDSQALEHTMIEAHQRKGEILDLLGKMSEALTEFKLASELAEAALGATPENLQSNRDLANSLMMVGESHRKAFAYDQAGAIYRRVLDIRQKIANAFPDNIELQHGLTSVKQRIADLYYFANAWDKAQSEYENLLLEIEPIAVEHPQNSTLQRDLCIAHERLGTLATKAGKVEMANHHFLQVTQINQTLLLSEPENILYKSDLAYVTKRLASLAIASGDYSRAVDLAHQSEDYYSQISKAEPLDSEARRNVGSAWDTVFDTHLAAGHLEDASRAIEKACDIFLKLCDEFPETAKFPVLAVEALFKQAELQMRQGRWAESVPLIHQCIEYLERCQKAVDADPRSFEPAIKASNLLLEGLSYLSSDGTKTTSLSSLSRDGKHMGQLFLMYELSRCKKIDEAMELGKTLDTYISVDPYVAANGDLVLSRAWAICFAGLQKEDGKQGDVALSETIQKDDCAKHCVRVIERMLRVNPAFQEHIIKDPDYSQLRQKPEFRQFLP